MSASESFKTVINPTERRVYTVDEEVDIILLAANHGEGAFTVDVVVEFPDDVMWRETKISGTGEWEAGEFRRKDSGVEPEKQAHYQLSLKHMREANECIEVPARILIDGERVTEESLTLALNNNAVK